MLVAASANRMFELLSLLRFRCSAAAAPLQLLLNCWFPQRHHTPSSFPKRGTVEKTAYPARLLPKRMHWSLDVSRNDPVTGLKRDPHRSAALQRLWTAAAREGASLTFLPFFVQAALRALQQHPL